MSSVFIYNAEFQVLICSRCQTCIRPNRRGQTRHLYNHPHHIKGQELKVLLNLFETYPLNPGDHTNVPQMPVSMISGLKTYDGTKCSHCECFPISTSASLISKHVSREHQVSPKEQMEGRDWRRIRAQTFFAETTHRRYFEVHDCQTSSGGAKVDDELNKGCQALLYRLIDDEQSFDERTSAESSIVGGFDVHKSEAVPWLDRTGIERHLRGLPKAQILSSYRLPQADDPGVDSKLIQILGATSTLLNSAYQTALPASGSTISWASMLVLNNFSASGGRPSAFLAKKSASSLKTYFGYWKQLIAYCWITMYAAGADDHFSLATEIKGQLTPNDITMDSDNVLQAWVKIAAMTADADDEGKVVNKRTEERLMELLMDVFIGLICHQTGSNGYQSPIVSFAAMLTVKPTTGTWHEPGDFNSKLSGIIWVSQLLLFHHCTRQEVVLRRQVSSSLADDQYRGPSAHDLLKKVCRKYMRCDEETPMGELLGWRALLFGISMNSSRRNQAYWNEDGDSVTYKNTSLRLANVETLLKAEYERALNLLSEQLLFGSSDIPPIAVPLLQDNMEDETIGTWFYHSNKSAIDRWALFKELEKHPAVAARFMRRSENVEGTGTVLDAAAIKVYEGYVQTFLRRLLVLIHLGSGQPARSGEILSAKWKNTANQRRSIIIRHRKVMMHLTYHKGLEKTAQSKDNIRFLPGPIGDLLVKFLVYVQPIRQMFLRHQSPDMVLSPYLWQKDGHVWEDQKLSDCMKESCQLTAVPILSVSTWRQITVAIVTKCFSNEAHLFDVDRSGPEGSDAGGGNEVGAMMATQRNHSKMTANLAYASHDTFGGIWDEQLQLGYRASMLWSNLFRIESALKWRTKRQRPEDGINFDENPLSKRLDASRPQKKRLWSKTQLLEEGRRAFHDPRWKWKTAFQASAMEIVMQWREIVIVVCPTGGGKSMLFMLPCLLPEAHTTIVVLPLVSLRGDMIRRLGEQGIRFLQWSPGEVRQAPLVITSAEAACSTEFQSYAQSLVSQNRLDRIVIDECHMTLTASDYRQSMLELGALRMLATRFVYLTATLPPSMYSNFVQQNHLFEPRLVRSQVNRPNIAYSVTRHLPNNEMIDRSVQAIRRTWRHGVDGLGFSPEDKGIIYCRTKEGVKTLAASLGCASYTSESGAPAAKEQIIRSWLMDPEKPFIVATSALGAGFDYPHVRTVWHVDAPSSMVNFAQETGRAGRDGEVALSVVFLSDIWQPDPAWRGKPDTDRGAMTQYLYSENCLRGLLSGFLDGEPCISKCRPRQDQLCGRCEGQDDGRDGKDGVEGQPNAVTQPSGPRLIREQRQQWESMTIRLREWLDVLSGMCLLCRGRGRPRYDHQFDSCVYRKPFIMAKNMREEGKARWFKPFTCCYLCALPQQYCQPTAREGNSHSTANTSCAYPDMVMPLCWAMWENDIEGKWFETEFGQAFEDEIGYLNWLGQPLDFAGKPAIYATSVMFKALRSWGI